MCEFELLNVKMEYAKTCRVRKCRYIQGTTNEENANNGKVSCCTREFQNDNTSKITIMNFCYLSAFSDVKRTPNIRYPRSVSHQFNTSTFPVFAIQYSKEPRHALDSPCQATGSCFSRAHSQFTLISFTYLRLTNCFKVNDNVRNREFRYPRKRIQVHV